MAVVKAFEPRIGHDLLHREAEDRTCAYRVEQGQRGGKDIRPAPTRADPFRAELCPYYSLLPSALRHWCMNAGAP